MAGRVGADLSHGVVDDVPPLPRQVEDASLPEGGGQGVKTGGGGGEASGGEGDGIPSPSKDRDRRMRKQKRSSIPSLFTKRTSNAYIPTNDEVFPGWGEEKDYNWEKLVAIGSSAATSEKLPVEAKDLPMRKDEENLIKSHWKVVRQAHDVADVFFTATRKAQEAEKRAGQLEDVDDEELEAGQVEECEAKWAEAEAERANAARALGNLHSLMLDVEEAFERVSQPERIKGARIMLDTQGCKRLPHLNGVVGVLDNPTETIGVWAVWFPGMGTGGLVEDVRSEEMLHASSRFQRSALLCIENAKIANHDATVARQQSGGQKEAEEAAARAKKAVDVSDSEQAAMVAPLSHSIPWYSTLIKGAVTWPGCIVRDTDEWCVPGRNVLISPVCKEMQGMVGYAGLVGHLKSRVRAGEWSVRFPQVQGTAIKECFIKVGMSGVYGLIYQEPSHVLARHRAGRGHEAVPRGPWLALDAGDLVLEGEEDCVKNTKVMLSYEGQLKQQEWCGLVGSLASRVAIGQWLVRFPDERLGRLSREAVLCVGSGGCYDLVYAARKVSGQNAMRAGMKRVHRLRAAAEAARKGPPAHSSLGTVAAVGGKEREGRRGGLKLAMGELKLEEEEEVDMYNAVVEALGGLGLHDWKRRLASLERTGRVLAPWFFTDFAQANEEWSKHRAERVQTRGLKLSEAESMRRAKDENTESGGAKLPSMVAAHFGLVGTLLACISRGGIGTRGRERACVRAAAAKLLGALLDPNHADARQALDVLSGEAAHCTGLEDPDESVRRACATALIMSAHVGDRALIARIVHILSATPDYLAYVPAPGEPHVASKDAASTISLKAMRSACTVLRFVAPHNDPAVISLLVGRLAAEPVSQGATSCVVSLFRGKGAVASKGNKRAVQAALSGDACTVLGMGNSMLRRALGDVLVQLVGKEDEEVSSQVVSWLEGDDWGVREAVGLVLARICGKGDAGAQRAVIEKVREGADWSIRMSAVRALGLIAGGSKFHESISALQERADSDESGAVRWAALKTIASLTGGDAGHSNKTSPEAFTTEVSECKRLLGAPPPVGGAHLDVPALIEAAASLSGMLREWDAECACILLTTATSGGHPTLRSAACKSLGAVLSEIDSGEEEDRGEESRAMLRRLAMSCLVDPEAGVRRAASGAITSAYKKNGSPEMIRGLVKCVSSPNVREEFGQTPALRAAIAKGARSCALSALISVIPGEGDASIGGLVLEEIAEKGVYEGLEGDGVVGGIPELVEALRLCMGGGWSQVCEALREALAGAAEAGLKRIAGSGRDAEAGVKSNAFPGGHREEGVKLDVTVVRLQEAVRVASVQEARMLSGSAPVSPRKGGHLIVSKSGSDTGQVAEFTRRASISSHTSRSTATTISEATWQRVLDQEMFEKFAAMFSPSNLPSKKGSPTLTLSGLEALMVESGAVPDVWSKQDIISGFCEVISLRYRRAGEKEVEYAKQVMSSGDLKARGDAARRDVEVCEGLKKVMTRLRGVSKRAREGTSKGKSEGDAWMQGIEQAVAKAGEIYTKLKGGAARLGGEGVKLEWEKDGRPSEVPEGVGVEVVLKEARRREDSFVRRLEGGYGAGSGTEAGDGFEGSYEIRGEIRGIDLKILGVEKKIDGLLKRREKAAMGLDALDDLGDLRDEGGRSHVDLFNDLVNVTCRRDSSPAGSLGQRTRAYTEAKSMLEFEAWRKIQEEIEVLRTEEKACEGARDELERRLEGIEELEGADIGELVEDVKQSKAATSETLQAMEKNRLALGELRRREGRAKVSREAKRCDLEAIRGEISELDAEMAVIISLFAGWEREVAAGGKEGADWRDTQREMFRAMDEEQLKVACKELRTEYRVGDAKLWGKLADRAFAAEKKAISKRFREIGKLIGSPAPPELGRTPAALERVESGVSRSASSGEVGDGDPGVDAGGRKRGAGLSARKEDAERELKALDETIENLENSRRAIEGKWNEGYLSLMSEADLGRKAASDLRDAKLLQQGEETSLRRELAKLRAFISQQQQLARSLSASLRRTSARVTRNSTGGLAFSASMSRRAAALKDAATRCEVDAARWRSKKGDAETASLEFASDAVESVIAFAATVKGQASEMAYAAEVLRHAVGVKSKATQAPLPVKPVADRGGGGESRAMSDINQISQAASTALKAVKKDAAALARIRRERHALLHELTYDDLEDLCSSLRSKVREDKTFERLTAGGRKKPKLGLGRRRRPATIAEVGSNAGGDGDDGGGVKNAVDSRATLKQVKESLRGIRVLPWKISTAELIPIFMSLADREIGEEGSEIVLLPRRKLPALLDKVRAHVSSKVAPKAAGSGGRMPRKFGGLGLHSRGTPSVLSVGTRASRFSEATRNTHTSAALSEVTRGTRASSSTRRSGAAQSDPGDQESKPAANPPVPPHTGAVFSTVARPRKKEVASLVSEGDWSLTTRGGGSCPVDAHYAVVKSNRPFPEILCPVTEVSTDGKSIRITVPDNSMLPPHLAAFRYTSSSSESVTIVTKSGSKIQFSVHMNLRCRRGIRVRLSEEWVSLSPEPGLYAVRLGQTGILDRRVGHRVWTVKWPFHPRAPIAEQEYPIPGALCYALPPPSAPLRPSPIKKGEAQNLSPEPTDVAHVVVTVSGGEEPPLWDLLRTDICMSLSSGKLEAARKLRKRITVAGYRPAPGRRGGHDVGLILFGNESQAGGALASAVEEACTGAGGGVGVLASKRMGGKIVGARAVAAEEGWGDGRGGWGYAEKEGEVEAEGWGECVSGKGGGGGGRPPVVVRDVEACWRCKGVPLDGVGGSPCPVCAGYNCVKGARVVVRSGSLQYAKFGGLEGILSKRADVGKWWATFKGYPVPALFGVPPRGGGDLEYQGSGVGDSWRLLADSVKAGDAVFRITPGEGWGGEFEGSAKGRYVEVGGEICKVTGVENGGLALYVQRGRCGTARGSHQSGERVSACSSIPSIPLPEAKEKTLHAGEINSGKGGFLVTLSSARAGQAVQIAKNWSREVDPVTGMRKYAEFVGRVGTLTQRGDAGCWYVRWEGSRGSEVAHQVSGGVYTLEYVGSFTGGRLRVPPTGGVEFTFCLSRPISKGEEVFIHLGLFTSGGERASPANPQKERKKPVMKTTVFVPDGLMHVRNESPKCLSERFAASSPTAMVYPTCPPDLPGLVSKHVPKNGRGIGSVAAWTEMQGEDDRRVLAGSLHCTPSASFPAGKWDEPSHTLTLKAGALLPAGARVSVTVPESACLFNAKPLGGDAEIWASGVPKARLVESGGGPQLSWCNFDAHLAPCTDESGGCRMLMDVGCDFEAGFELVPGDRVSIVYTGVNAMRMPAGDDGSGAASPIAEDSRYAGEEQRGRIEGLKLGGGGAGLFDGSSCTWVNARSGGSGMLLMSVGPGGVPAGRHIELVCLGGQKLRGNQVVFQVTPGDQGVVEAKVGIHRKGLGVVVERGGRVRAREAGRGGKGGGWWKRSVLEWKGDQKSDAVVAPPGDSGEKDFDARGTAGAQAGDKIGVGSGVGGPRVPAKVKWVRRGGGSAMGGVGVGLVMHDVEDARRIISKLQGLVGTKERSEDGRNEEDRGEGRRGDRAKALFGLWARVCLRSFRVGTPSVLFAAERAVTGGRREGLDLGTGKGWQAEEEEEGGVYTGGSGGGGAEGGGGSLPSSTKLAKRFADAACPLGTEVLVAGTYMRWLGWRPHQRGHSRANPICKCDRGDGSERGLPKRVLPSCPATVEPLGDRWRRRCRVLAYNATKRVLTLEIPVHSLEVLPCMKLAVVPPGGGLESAVERADPAEGDASPEGAFALTLDHDAEQPPGGWGSADWVWLEGLRVNGRTVRKQAGADEDAWDGYVVFRGGCVVGDDESEDISGPFAPFSKRRWGGIRSGRLALELSAEEREKALLLKPLKKQVMGSRLTASSPRGSAGISVGEGVLAELGRIRRYAAWRALWKLKRTFDRAMSISSEGRGKENSAPSLQGPGGMRDVNHATAKGGERVFVKPGWEVIEDKRWPVGRDDSTGSSWQRWRLVAGGGRKGKGGEDDGNRGRWRVDSLSTRIQEWSKIQAVRSDEAEHVHDLEVSYHKEKLNVKRARANLAQITADAARVAESGDAALLSEASKEWLKERGERVATVRSLHAGKQAMRDKVGDARRRCGEVLESLTSARQGLITGEGDDDGGQIREASVQRGVLSRPGHFGTWYIRLDTDPANELGPFDCRPGTSMLRYVKPRHGAQVTGLGGNTPSEEQGHAGGEEESMRQGQPQKAGLAKEKEEGMGGGIKVKAMTEEEKKEVKDVLSDVESLALARATAMCNVATEDLAKWAEYIRFPGEGDAEMVKKFIVECAVDGDVLLSCDLSTLVAGLRSVREKSESGPEYRPGQAHEVCVWHGRHVRIYGRKGGIADTDYGPAPESELAQLTADEAAERSRAEQIWASDRVKLMRQIASASLDLHLCARSVFNVLSAHVKAGAMGIPSSSLPSLLHQPPVQFSPPLTTREVDVVRGACTSNKAGCVDAESLSKGFDALIAHQLEELEEGVRMQAVVGKRADLSFRLASTLSECEDKARSQTLNFERLAAMHDKSLAAEQKRREDTWEADVDGVPYHERIKKDGVSEGATMAEAIQDGCQVLRLALSDCGFSKEEVGKLVGDGSAGKTNEMWGHKQMSEWIGSLDFPAKDAQRYKEGITSHGIDAAKLFAWRADDRRRDAQMSSLLGMINPLHRAKLLRSFDSLSSLLSWSRLSTDLETAEGVTALLRRVRNQAIAKHGTLMNAFRAADTEKDGGLTTSELGEALKKLELNLSAKVLGALVRIADEDKSGTVEYKEWGELLQRPEAQHVQEVISKYLSEELPDGKKEGRNGGEKERDGKEEGAIWVPQGDYDDWMALVCEREVTTEEQREAGEFEWMGRSLKQGNVEDPVAGRDGWAMVYDRETDDVVYYGPVYKADKHDREQWRMAKKQRAKDEVLMACREGQDKAEQALREQKAKMQAAIQARNADKRNKKPNAGGSSEGLGGGKDGKGRWGAGGLPSAWDRNAWGAAKGMGREAARARVQGMKENRVVMPSKASAARKGALGKNVVADVTLRMMEVEQGRLLDCAHLLNWALLTNRADHNPEKERDDVEHARRGAPYWGEPIEMIVNVLGGLKARLTDGQKRYGGEGGGKKGGGGGAAAVWVPRKDELDDGLWWKIKIPTRAEVGVPFLLVYEGIRAVCVIDKASDRGTQIEVLVKPMLPNDRIEWMIPSRSGFGYDSASSIITLARQQPEWPLPAREAEEGDGPQGASVSGFSNLHVEEKHLADFLTRTLGMVRRKRRDGSEGGLRFGRDELMAKMVEKGYSIAVEDKVGDTGTGGEHGGSDAAKPRQTGSVQHGWG